MSFEYGNYETNGVCSLDVLLRQEQAVKEDAIIVGAVAVDLMMQERTMCSAISTQPPLAVVSEGAYRYLRGQADWNEISVEGSFTLQSGDGTRVSPLDRLFHHALREKLDDRSKRPECCGPS